VVVVDANRDDWGSCLRVPHRALVRLHGSHRATVGATARGRRENAAGVVGENGPETTRGYHGEGTCKIGANGNVSKIGREESVRVGQRAGVTWGGCKLQVSALHSNGYRALGAGVQGMAEVQDDGQ
jgi:hypothetical protein